MEIKETPVADCKGSKLDQGSRNRAWPRYGLGWLLVLPTLVVVVTFTIVPLGLALISSLTVDKWTDPLGLQGSFVGLANYQTLFANPIFAQVMSNTLTFLGVTVPVSLVLAFAFALLVNGSLKGQGILRLGFFYPAILPMVGAGTIWLFIYNRNFGLLNQVISWLGIPAQNWLGSPRWALTAVMVMTIWKITSYYMIFFLAGLQNLPDDVLEAGKIDGANNWQSLIYLILPLLKNTIFFVTVIALTDAFQTYDQIAVLTKDGGPNHATNLLLFNIRIAFSNGDYDLANSQSIILVIIILSLTILAYWISEGRRQIEE